MAWSEIIGHDRPVQILQAALRSGRVAEAYLLTGPEGIGKRLIGCLFSQALLCAVGGPCGQCAACRKSKANNHPDLIALSPKDGPSIKIDQIETLQGSLIFRPLEGGRRVVLIEPADRLTPEAANRLLKTLEEPPTACTFLLITAKPDLLPSTVRSRCQTIAFSPTPPPLIEQALVARGMPPERARLVATLSGGSLGRALDLDPDDEEAIQRQLRDAILQGGQALLELAEEYGKDTATTEKALRIILLWLQDELLSGHRLAPEAVFRLLDLAHEIEDGLRRNVHRALALEVLFMEVSAALAAASASSPSLGVSP